MIGGQPVIDKTAESPGYRPNACAFAAACQRADSGPGRRRTADDKRRFAYRPMLLIPRLAVIPGILLIRL